MKGRGGGGGSGVGVGSKMTPLQKKLPTLKKPSLIGVKWTSPTQSHDQVVA